MATYDLSLVRSKVRDRLDDPNYDAAVIDGFINDTQREVLNTYTFPFMESTFSGTLTAGYDSYEFPLDAQSVISFRVTAPDEDSRFLQFMEFREFDQKYPDPAQADPGRPEKWTSISGLFKIYPVADEDYELDLRYIKKPDELTADSDVPEIPEAFQEILVLGAHARVLVREDQITASQIVKREMRELTADMVKRLTLRQTGEPYVMRTGRMRRGRL